jgi:hypothetical protein
MGDQLTAWDVVGYDPYDYPGTVGVRLAGGRTVYEAVANTSGGRVCLSRLDTSDGLRAVTRYVDADTPVVLVAGD